MLLCDAGLGDCRLMSPLVAVCQGPNYGQYKKAGKRRGGDKGDALPFCFKSVAVAIAINFHLEAAFGS